MKNSSCSPTAGHRWLVSALILAVVCLVVGIACGRDDNVEAPVPTVPTPRPLASNIPVAQEPTQAPIQLATPPSSDSVVQGKEKLGQSPNPTAPVVQSAVPKPEPNLDPTVEAPLAPMRPTTDETRKGSPISLGLFFACALESDGKPLCWNFTKELGPESPFYDGPLSPPPQEEKFVSISSGDFHTCGLREDGTPACWPATTDEVFSSLNPPPTGERFSSIDSRDCYTCGLRSDGSPVCWAQIRGLVPCQDYELAEPPPGEKFVALTGGEGFSCGLRDDGTFLCYPDVQGVRQSDEAKLPQMPGAERYSAISMGWGSFCALRRDGTPTCWHWNVVATSWVRNEVEPDVGKLVSISTGTFHSCGLRETGEIACWWTAHAADPGPWPSEEATFVAIASKGFYSCGMKEDGSRICWNANPTQ